MVVTYDPGVDSMSTPIEPSVNEELALQALARNEEKPSERKNLIPTGLLPPEALVAPEKNLDESQMADFSTAIEDVMPGPGRMMQDEVMGPPMGPSAMMQGNKPTPRDDGAKGSRSKNPLGLTDDQFMAVLAGVAGVIAFSKPVQGKLSTMVPKFLGESGEVSTTGLAVTALLAAIIFYFAKQFLKDKA
jgi:hypothetical protein